MRRHLHHSPPHLHLHVPSLIWPHVEPDDEPVREPALPALSRPALRLLARGDFARAAPLPFEDSLAAAFGLDLPAPHAALRLAGEEARPATEGYWLCADPVHLAVNHHTAVVREGELLSLSMAEAQALCAGLNAHFADLGDFHAAAPQRWYLRLSEPRRLATSPLSAIAGAGLGEHLPRGDSAWAAPLLTEAQMVLAAHPVNAARLARGLPPANSVWLWGGGALSQPGSGAAPFATVYSDLTLARGLARHCGASTRPLPESAAELLAQNLLPGDGAALVVLDALLAPAQYEDAEAWRAAWLALDENWLSPLAAALDAGRLGSVEIVSATAHGLCRWRATRRDRWKLWRRPRSLASWTNAIVEKPC